jgi:hypothetical protein
MFVVARHAKSPFFAQVVTALIVLSGRQAMSDCGFKRGGVRLGRRFFLLFGMVAATQFAHGALQPAITSVIPAGNTLIISVNVPDGFKNAVLQAGNTVIQPPAAPLIAGGMNGAAATLTFHVPNTGGLQFFRVIVGTSAAIPSAPLSGSEYFSVEYNVGPLALSAEEKVGHVLSRLSYGPTPDDMLTVQAMGVPNYINQQLNPDAIDDSALAPKEAALFTIRQPGDDHILIKPGDTWAYMKGTQAAPTGWNSVGFNDSTWLQGSTGIGYGDNDDATVLADMQKTGANPGYLTVYLRKSFVLNTPGDVDALILSVDYDDGFVAYLNGAEVARVNVAGKPALFSEAASGDHEAGTVEDFDLSQNKSLLRAGENVIAIEVHNVSITSSDLSMIPTLLSRKFLPVPPVKRIKGIDQLQELAHVRGIYTSHQLQAVLAEFWNNHFTTDYDKVADYFGNLRNSDAQPAMSDQEATSEGAQAEYLEYEFFYKNALGNFGDLLLYSATSPTMLIYLDNVLNVKGAANENYAREIQELFAFGVDNRYTQQDIEQLARCFTGWGIRKVSPSEVKPFPDSARNPPIEDSVQYDDEVLLDSGPGWSYFKGTQEPSPAAGGGPDVAWTGLNFNDAAWLPGATGIGYGDNDDATLLSDMQNKYMSVYLRRKFSIPNPEQLENLILSVDYDDGFIAYVNGTEVARSTSMQNTGTPPAYNKPSSGSHEAGTPESFNISKFRNLLKPAPEQNVLAIQVHNVTLDSSDISIIPRLVQRSLRPGSIENGDPNGIWAFRFNPAKHDTGQKVLYKGTPNQITVPAGRTGIEGLRDAMDIVDSFVNHPSVSEFICIKLVNKFVSDEINLRSYKDGSAPADLIDLVNSAIQAWNSTTPRGNIRTVMNAILSPSTQTSYFWSRAAFRGKIKTAVEFINSSARALKADVNGTSLPSINDDLGMHMFTRDEPDGWAEVGNKWIDTGTMLSRIKFAQSLASDRVSSVHWDFAAWRTAHNISSAESIVDYFNNLLFQGKMDAANRALLIKFASTDDAGAPLPLDPQKSDYEARVRELVGLILSMPQWHYQ